MSLRAGFTRSYLRRYLLLAGLGIAWTAYCAYDGLISYPKKLKISQAYEKLNGRDSGAVSDSWRKITEEKGWSDEIPRPSEEIEHLIKSQYLMGAIGLAIGLPGLFLFLRSRGSWVEMDGQSIATSWGQTMDFNSVQQLDKTKWARKGIARARYAQNGQTRTLVFDDFKFAREPLGEMLCALEETLSPDQIVGGPPENAVTDSDSEDTEEDESDSEA